MHFKLWLLLGATIAQAGPVVKRNNGGGEDNNTDGEVLSSFVGLSSSQVYTGNFGPQATKSFPPASVVGFPGHTPTGAEPFVIQTGLPNRVPKVQDEAFPLMRPEIKDAGDDFDVFEYWGNLSPVKTLKGSHWGLEQASPIVPDQCSITQVHLTMRHGARYPTSNSLKFPGRLQDAIANGSTITASGDLEFLGTWTNKLGADLLSPYGRLQNFEYGVAKRFQYGHLLTNFTESGKRPVFRTQSQDRMVKTLEHFSLGFWGYPDALTAYDEEIVIEGSGYNNTGAPYYTCNNSDTVGYFGEDAAKVWAVEAFKPTAERLQPMLEGFEFSSADIVDMISLCAYEEVNLGFSRFCSLFNVNDFKTFEKYLDITYYYDSGPGSPVAAAQGKGYLEQFVARLNHTKPPTDGDSTANTTFTGNPTYFPLDQSIYMDATHEVVILNYLTALNMTGIWGTEPYPINGSDYSGKFRSSTVIPFRTSLEIQVLECAPSSPSTQVRFILNGGVLPLENAITGCKADPNGLCAKETVIAGLSKRLDEIDFDYACFGDYNATIEHYYGGLSPRPSSS